MKTYSRLLLLALVVVPLVRAATWTPGYSVGKISYRWVDASHVTVTWGMQTIPWYPPNPPAPPDEAVYFFVTDTPDTVAFNPASQGPTLEYHASATIDSQRAGSVTIQIQPGLWVYVQQVDTDGAGNTSATAKVYSKFSLAKKVRVSVLNSSDLVKNYQVVDGDGAVLQSFQLQPHTGIVASVDVPAGTPGPITLIEQINGYVMDSNGQWQAVAGGITTVNDSVNGGSSGLTVRDQNDPGSDTLDPVSVGPSGTGNESTNGGSVWRAVADTTQQPTDVLTKPVYREGVDKITSRLDAIKGDLEGATVATQSFDSSADAATYKTSADASKVSSVLGKLPAAPAITLPTASTAVWSFSMPIPGASQTYPVTIDLSAYQTPISVFRALVIAALSLWFFFLSVRAIKEAFA